MTMVTPSPLASSSAFALAAMPAVLQAIRAGRPVLVLDDADRENEADLVCAAELITPAVMAMMIREGSGIVCLCMLPERATDLQLRSMVEVNRSRHETAFTQSRSKGHTASAPASRPPTGSRPSAARCARRRSTARSSRPDTSFRWSPGPATCWSGKATPKRRWTYRRWPASPRPACCAS